MIDLSLYNIYLDKQVLVTLQNGESVSGILDDITENSLLIGDQMLPGDTVADMQYCGTVDLSTYEMAGGKLFIGNNLCISEQDLAVIDPHYRYGEHVIEYRCHLQYDAFAKCTVATDMSLVSARHGFSANRLSQEPHLFRIDDGDWFYAEFVQDETGSFLKTPDTQLPFDPAHITDITRCPIVGKDAVVHFTNGETLESAIASVSPAAFQS